jgi:hypothetical protein
MLKRYRKRRDTAANWTAENPILLSGEEGYETNTRKSKTGDGTTAWNSLPYSSAYLLDTANTFTEDQTIEGILSANRVAAPEDGTAGGIAFYKGFAGYTGYLQFIKPNGDQHGAIGFDNTNDISFGNDNAGVFKFNKGIDVTGNVVHTGQVLKNGYNAWCNQGDAISTNNNADTADFGPHTYDTNTPGGVEGYATRQGYSPAFNDYGIQTFIARTGTPVLYVRRQEAGTWGSWIAVASGGTWGSITGTLSDQTDLQTALNAKVTSGGALGTPSSGTVTNLTGTAAININGTVGATTPNSVVSNAVTVTPAANGQSVLRINQAGGTRSLSFGTFSTAASYAGFWAGSATPSDTNFAFLSDGVTETIFNVASGGSLAFRIAQVTQPLTVFSTGVRIGTGSATTLQVLSSTATLDFGSVAANSFVDLTVIVTGAGIGDIVSIGVPNGAMTSDISFFGWVSAANTVSIRCSNVSSTTARDPASGTFRATVTRF